MDAFPDLLMAITPLVIKSLYQHLVAMAEILGVVASVVAITQLSNEIVRYLQTVHDAGQDALDYSREVPSFAALLNSLNAHITQKGIQDGDEWFDSVRALQRGPMQQYQAALEAFKAKVAPKAGFREKVAQHLRWQFIKDDVKDILAKMERLKNFVGIALQMDHLQAIHSITSEIKDDTTVIRATGQHHTNALGMLKRKFDKYAETTSKVKEDTTFIRETGRHHTTELAALKRKAQTQSDMSSAILQDTSQIGSLCAEARSAEEANHKSQLLEWLSTHDHSKEQHDNVSRFKEGAGKWLLDDQKFKQWIDGKFDTLFCVGMPGAGKTVMSAMIIRHLFRTFRLSHDRVAVAFLYFRYDSRGTQSTEQTIGSLVKQLVDQVVKVPDAIEQEFKERFTNRYEGRPWLFLLQAAVESFSCVYFVLDALDEGEALRTKGLISTIRSLQNARIKLFATSRIIPDIKQWFRGDESIEIRGSDDDISSYAESRICELPSCAQTTPGLREEIVQAIVTSTQGMFLLAKLHIDSLKDKRSVKAIKSTFTMLPRGSSAYMYDKAYDVAMKRIGDQPEKNKKLAKEVLTWVTYAMRPISATDLETAISVELGAASIDPDNIVPIDDLLSLCAGLVTLDEMSKTVKLVHQTTQEYFSRHPRSLLQDPHRTLSNVCLSYLGIDDFLDRSYKDAQFPEDIFLTSHIRAYPFLSYAATHWEDHSRQSLPFTSEKEAAQTQALEIHLLRNNALMESYFRARGDWEWNRETAADTYRSTTGLKFTFERKTGLQYAAANGNLEQVAALIKVGVDPNESIHGTTALIEAAQCHHESVVRFLIEEARADVDCQGRRSNHTPLTATLGMDGRDTHRKFPNWLETIDDDHETDTDHHSAIELIEPIVAFLLEAGASPDHITDPLYGLTPLMFASRHGMQSIVSMLCAAGVDINRQCRQRPWNLGDRTALHLAAVHGHDNVVKQLLHHGCDPNTNGVDGYSPIASAAKYGRWTTVELLLDVKGIDLDRKTGDGETVLYLVCVNKSRPVALIRRMLEKVLVGSIPAAEH